MNKRRNRLTCTRADKLITIYYNRRSLERKLPHAGEFTEDQVAEWVSKVKVHATFPLPTSTSGAHMVGDSVDDADGFDCMHGDVVGDDPYWDGGL